MKLCKLLVLVPCIHLPLILFACTSSGHIQSCNIDSQVVPSCCDVIDTAMAGDPIAFWGFLNFSRNVLFWSLQASSMFIFTLLCLSGKIWRAILPWKLIYKEVKRRFFDSPTGCWLMCTLLVDRVLHIWSQRTLATCAGRSPICTKRAIFT